jgi:hypothetical protein
MAAVNPFAGMRGDLASPSIDGAAVTPNDTTDLPTVPRRLWIGGAGNVKINTAAGNPLTYTGVPAGAYLSIRPSRVFATGTTATNIVAEY